MKKTIFKLLALNMLLALAIVSCNSDNGNNSLVDDIEDTDDNDTDDNDTDDNQSSTDDAGCNPTLAFDEFNTGSVTISYDGDEMTFETTALPNHTSPYWSTNNDLYIDPVVADVSQMSPGTITSGSYNLTVPTCPSLASSSSSTGLGAIGISVTGVPIFNDEEGPNTQLSATVASGFDYAGGHNGPTGYHYHLESSDVDENTVMSHDDDALNGIMQDGFLLYGRKCNSTGTYPTDLDDSGGHVSATQHSDGEEFYHYHIINEIYTGTYIILFGGDLQGTPNTIQ